MLSALPGLFLVSAIAFAEGGDNKEWNCFTDYAFGKTYKSCFDLKAIFKSPKWDEDAEDPPISPRKALKLASQMRDAVAKAPDGWKWQPTALELFGGTGNHWAWKVSYQGQSTSSKRNVEIHTLRLLVYMDGTVVEPSVSDDEPTIKSQGLD